MKRKFTGILMCLLMVCMTIFAGCNLITPDNQRLYNAVVSEIKNKDGKVVAQITNRDLIAGYRSYGQNYQYQYGYTVEQAVDRTLEILQNTKVTVITAEDLFGVDIDGTGLDTKTKTYLWQTTLDSLLGNLDTYYQEIIDDDDEESEPASVTFNGYTKNAECDYDENGNRIIKSLETNDIFADFTPRYGDRDIKNPEDKQYIYSIFLDSLYDDNYKKAYDHYLRDQNLGERGMKLSTDTPSIFSREIDRLYRIAYENYLVQRYSNNFRQDNGSYISEQDILNLYASKVRAGYTQYVVEADSGYDEDVQSSLDQTYYFKFDPDATQFFTVVNILFKFSDAQTALKESYQNKLDADDGGSYDQDDYDNDINNLYLNIKPIIREDEDGDGTYVEVENTENWTTNYIIDNIIAPELKAAQATNNVNDIGDVINDLVYRYNQDDGMMNATSNYVIGVDSNRNAVSSFVKEFNDAGLALYNNGEGKVGDMKVTRSDYGIHVLVYTGKCENLFGNIDNNFTLSEGEDGAFEKLYTTRVNPLVDKTYFDVLYDEIYTDQYSYFENANLEYLKSKYDIYIYRSQIPDALR